MGSTFLYAAPVVEILTCAPSAGPLAGAIPVVILGRGFQVGATVTFDGAAATGVTVESDARIACTIPAHAAGAVDVDVVNPDASTAAFPGGFMYEAVAPIVHLTYRTPANAPASRMRTETSPPQIQQTLGQPSTFTFSAADEPAGGQSVELRASGVSLFRGTVTQKSERIEGAARLQVWDVEATDDAHVLIGVHPIGEWASVSGTDVLQALLAFAPGFSPAGVEAGLDAVTLSLDGTTDLWAAILDVCAQCGAKAFLHGFTLHAFTASAGLAVGLVTEGNPDLLWPEGGENPITIDWDYASLHNRVTVRGAAGISATLDDGASIAAFNVRTFPVNDNTLTTQAECLARARAILDAEAWPIPTARYATRDLATHVGFDAPIEIERPAISGTFVIHSVTIDQLDQLAQGRRPRFTVTAKPASASLRSRGDVVGLLQSVVDLTATAAQSPRLSGDVESTPGGRTTIPDGSIAASKLAGCLGSDLLEPTGVTPGAYGDDAHLPIVTVDAAGRITEASTDPIAIAKTDGSQPYTGDQPMDGHTLTDLRDPVNPQEPATMAFVEAAIAAAGVWSPLTNGNGSAPELIFDSSGDVIMVFTP